MSPEDADPPERRDDGMTGRTVDALRWTYAAALLGIVPQLVYTTVMARLLEPAAFGLVALAQLYLRFGAYFSNLGVGQALIQKEELSDRDVRAAFTSTTALGALFALVAALTAPLFADAFDSPDVTPIVRAMGIAFLLDGLGRTASSLLRRDLRFDTLARIEVPSYVVAYLGVGLGSAALGAGVWSLVAASLSQTALRSGAAFAARRHPVAPLLAPTEMRALYAFGGRVSLISVLQFVVNSLDVAFIGRFRGEEDLGQYNRATFLVAVPFTQLVNNLSKVLFPAFSRIQSDLGRLRGAYVTAVELLAAVLLPVAVGMGVAAPELVAVVLGDGWGDAATVLPLVALVQAVAFITSVDGLTLEAVARLNLKIGIEVGTAALAVAGFLALGAADTGLVTYAAAMLVVGLGRQVAYAVASIRVLGLGPGEVLRPWVRASAGAAVVALAIAAVSSALRPVAPAGLVLLAQVAAGAGSLALAFAYGPLVGARRRLRQRLDGAGLLGGGRAGRLADRLLSLGR